MSEFIAVQTLERIASLVRGLDRATTELAKSIKVLQKPSRPQVPSNPQVFVEQVLALDEQLSRARLLLPLCTTNVLVNDNGRTVALSDLLAETRSEFDTLARARLEVLIRDASV